jgi:glycosyltransferase involved in cell wall biosynthesis
MRILIWVPLISPGGGARLLRQLATAIARQSDVQAVRLAIPSKDDSLSDLADTVEVFAIEPFPGTRTRIRNGKQSRLKKVLEIFRGWLKANSRYQTQAPSNSKATTIATWENYQFQNASDTSDIVYVFWPRHQDVPTTDKPIVCTIQDLTDLDFPEIFGGDKTRSEWERTLSWLRRSNCVVVSSEATNTVLRKHFGTSADTAVVIHHAILPESSLANDVENKPLPIDLPDRFIVFPANINTHKNHFNLLVAWSHFAKRQQIPLVLIGSGTELLNQAPPNWPAWDQGARLVGLINRLGLIPRRDFYALGYVDDALILPIISRAEALIMPTLAEGGGSYPIEEALSVGVPVLCSDIPVLREHLAHRSAKVAWFDPLSPDSMVEALNQLFEHYEEYKQSAMAGRTDARPSWDDVGAQYVAVFQSVLERHKK